MKTYSAEDIKELKAFNSKSCIGTYKVKTGNGYAVIDNKEGYGNSKATKEVFIKGFLASIKAEIFVTLYEHFEESALPTSNLPDISAGKSIANPIIFYDVEPYFEFNRKGPKIVGFDDVENAAALISANSDVIPVQVVLVGYSGSVKRSDALFRTWCGRNVESNKNVVAEPYIQLIFK